MIPRIRRGNDFKHVWPITWNGQPEDFSDATDITLTAKVYGQVKTLTEGVDYHIDGGTVIIDFTPAICDITGTYTVELNYIKPSAEFTDGDRRSAVDVQAFQIVNTSAEANATEGVSLPSEVMPDYALKYDDLTEAQKDELRGKGITAIDLTGEVGDTKTYTITYADGATFDFSVTDGHTPIFTFVGTVLHIDGVPQVDLKGETGNSIASVELTSTVGLVNTYNITFTDATTATFTVTDGSTPEITFQGTTIYVDGVAQVDLKGDAGYTPVITNNYWYINGVNTGIKAIGEDGLPIELQKTTTHIQWRVQGSGSWVNLISLSDLKGDTGIGIPTGGTTGQQLMKKSNVDYDFEWQTPAGAGDMLKSVYDSDGDGVVDNAEKVGGFTVETNVPANAKFTDTVYTHPETHPASMITQTVTARFVTEAQIGEWDAKETTTGAQTKATTALNSAKDYVDGRVLTDVPENAKFTDTVYTHPTTAGNKHIPTGGANGQILRYSASGTAVWGNENNTTYTAGQGLTLTGTVFTPDFGTGAGKVVQGNDARLSDARTPLAHNQAISTITGLQSALDDKVDNSRVLTDVPANAKFTDTTYEEITEAEINTGTASTLRTITARRVTFILSKVSTLISSAISALTKNDVGLGNVNNTSDANKPVSTAQAAAIALKIDANKFQVVAELPASPVTGVFYFVKE